MAQAEAGAPLKNHSILAAALDEHNRRALGITVTGLCQLMARDLLSDHGKIPLPSVCMVAATVMHARTRHWLMGRRLIPMFGYIAVQEPVFYCDWLGV